MNILNSIENIFSTEKCVKNDEKIDEDSFDLNFYSSFFDINETFECFINNTSANISFFYNFDSHKNIIEINATKKSIKNLNIDLKKGTLHFYSKNYNLKNKDININIYLDANKISKISKIQNKLNGNINFNLPNFVCKNLEILNESEGNIFFKHLIAENVTVNNSGSGSVNAFKGAINKIFDITLSNSGKLDFSYLLCDNVIAVLTGSGNAKIICRKNLTGKIKGKGDLKVYSFPKNIKVTEYSSGKVKIR